MAYTVYENGAYRNATDEEAAAIEAGLQLTKNINPTKEERISALESALLEVILGG